MTGAFHQGFLRADDTLGRGGKKKAMNGNEQKTCFLGLATSPLDGIFFRFSSFLFYAREDQRHPALFAVSWLRVLMSYLENYGLMHRGGDGGGGGRGAWVWCVLGAVANQVQWDPELRKAEEGGLKCVCVCFLQQRGHFSCPAAVDEDEEETVVVSIGATQQSQEKSSKFYRRVWSANDRSGFVVRQCVVFASCRWLIRLVNKPVRAAH